MEGFWDYISDLFEYYGPLLLALLAAFLLITFMLVSAIFSVWLERKVSGRIQDRLGPTRVGGKFGWLQTLADGVKLLCKEDIIPDPADRMLFKLGPYLALVGSFLAFLALPYGYYVVAQDMNIAVFYILAVLSTEVFGVILIGYGSGSKWSLFGGMREAAQMVSYEVPMAICIIIPIIVAGSMNLVDVASQQLWIWDWLVFRDPFTFAAFWLFFTCATASCKRAPFDLAEAESELVAGFHTEYSGFRWLSIYMAEYGSMFVVAGLANLMFLGGWGLGIGIDLYAVLGVFGNVLNVVIFIAKGWLLVFVMMWIRWTLPRLRIDQVMMTCLKYILPLSCVLLVGVCLWQLIMPEVVQLYFRFALCIAMLVLLGLLIKQWITWAQAPPSSAMPGMWRTAGIMGYYGQKKV